MNSSVIENQGLMSLDCMVAGFVEPYLPWNNSTEPEMQSSKFCLVLCLWCSMQGNAPFFKKNNWCIFFLFSCSPLPVWRAFGWPQSCSAVLSAAPGCDCWSVPASVGQTLSILLRDHRTIYNTGAQQIIIQNFPHIHFHKAEVDSLFLMTPKQYYIHFLHAENTLTSKQNI